MSVNKVILLGRLGSDPEVRYMADGSAVANARLATSESWKDKSGEKQEKTEWHNLTFYKRLAEVVGEHLKKGSQIFVEGKLQTRKWQDKEGKDRYTTEIICHEMTMLGGTNSGKPDVALEPSAPQATASNTNQQKPERNEYHKGAAFDDFDSDIPFAPHGKCGAGVSWRAM